MRKITLLLAVLAVAGFSSTADAAKKSRKPVAAQPAAQTANPNEAGARFARDAIPVFLPTWALPFYLSQQTEGPHAPQAAKPAKGKRVKQARRAQPAR